MTGAAKFTPGELAELAKFDKEIDNLPEVDYEDSDQYILDPHEYSKKIRKREYEKVRCRNKYLRNRTEILAKAKADWAAGKRPQKVVDRSQYQHEYYLKRKAATRQQSDNGANQNISLAL